jgi:hypothetical protein
VVVIRGATCALLTFPSRHGQAEESRNHFCAPRHPVPATARSLHPSISTCWSWLHCQFTVASRSRLATARRSLSRPIHDVGVSYMPRRPTRECGVQGYCTVSTKRKVELPLVASSSRNGEGAPRQTSVTPAASTRTCGPCRECCIAYPLLPNMNYWPEGKKAYVPCSHLCEGGCGIYHHQDRPYVCVDFMCLWLESGLGDERWRPDRCGVIVTPCRLLAYAGLKSDPG